MLSCICFNSYLIFIDVIRVGVCINNVWYNWSQTTHCTIKLTSTLSWLPFYLGNQSWIYTRTLAYSLQKPFDKTTNTLIMCSTCLSCTEVNLRILKTLSVTSTNLNQDCSVGLNKRLRSVQDKRSAQSIDRKNPRQDLSVYRWTSIVQLFEFQLYFFVLLWHVCFIS